MIEGMKSRIESFLEYAPFEKGVSFLVFLTLTFQLTSCFSFQEQANKIKKCRFQLKNVFLSSQSLLPFSSAPGLHFMLELDAENPNEEPVVLNRFELKIKNAFSKEDGEEVTLAEISSERQWDLPARGSKIVYLELVSNLSRSQKILERVVPGLIRDILSGNEPEFLVEGTIWMDTPLMEIPVPFSEKHKIHIKR